MVSYNIVALAMAESSRPKITQNLDSTNFIDEENMCPSEAISFLCKIDTVLSLVKSGRP